MKHSVVKFTAVNERLCQDYVKLACAHKKIKIIKVAFYEMIKELYDTLPDEDMNIIVGVFNAKLRRLEIYKPIMVRFSKH